MNESRTTKSNLFQICVITFPLNETGKVILLKFIKVLEQLSDEIVIIAGVFPGNRISIHNKRISIKNIEYSNKKRVTPIKIIDFILAQLKMSINLIRFSKNISIVIFFIGNELLLPMLSAKLLRKKIITVSAGSVSKSAKEIYRSTSFGHRECVLSHISGLLEKLNYNLSKRIILYSKNLIEEYNLEKYRDKISIAHRHFIDFDKFKTKKKLDDREYLVGYMGRLSEEKGTLNFVKAIPMISEERDDIRFLIVGTGELQDNIERYLEEKGLNEKVKLTGWVPHGELPDYLNALKLVVLPSYTEGLPNIMLEAMACGTPVLATPVGAIPEVIRDGETGFILENNSPKCITGNVIKVLEYPDLNKIVKNARKLVEKEFTYVAAVDRYKLIIDNMVVS